jgi:hypothetical protein
MDGTEVRVEAHAQATVFELKHKIQLVHSEHVPPSRQRLIFAGRAMLDEDTLSQHNVENEKVELYTPTSAAVVVQGRCLGQVVHLILRPADLPPHSVLHPSEVEQDSSFSFTPASQTTRMEAQHFPEGSMSVFVGEGPISINSVMV